MKGVKIMLSNSAVPEIEELYKRFNIQYVTTNRTINSDANKRTGFKDVIIINYKIV